MWHVRTLDALVREYDCEQDTADEVPPGLEYSSGGDSDIKSNEGGALQVHRGGVHCYGIFTGK